MNEFAINGGAGPQEAASRAARPARAPGDRPRDRQADDRQPRARGPRDARRHAERLPQPRVVARDPRRASVRLRPRQGEPDPRRRRLQGHQQRRHPRDARRRAAAEVPLRGALRGRAGQPTAELITGWLQEDRDRDDAEGLRRQPPDRGHRQGRLRHVRVGLDAVRRPRADALLLHLRSGQQDPKDPTNYYNDANWCDPQYDALYKRQKVELDRPSAWTSSTRCSRASTSRPSYDVLYTYPDLQAYRKGRFTGWIRQPEETGPVLFSNSSPTYATPEARGRRRPAARRRRRRRRQRRAHRDHRHRGGRARGRRAVARCAAAPPTSASERALRHRQGPRRRWRRLPSSSPSTSSCSASSRATRSRTSSAGATSARASAPS